MRGGVTFDTIDFHRVREGRFKMAKRPLKVKHEGSRVTAFDDEENTTDNESYTPTKVPRIDSSVPVWDRDSEGMVPLVISTRPQPPTLEEFFENHGVHPAQLYKPCPRDIRVRVASKVRDWYQLGELLGCFHGQLDEIKRDNVVNRFTNQRAEVMLDLWSERLEEKATYMMLLKALMRCDEKEIVGSMLEWINEKNILTRPVTCKLEALEREFHQIQNQLIADLVQKHVSTDMLWNSLTMLPDKFRREYESDIQAKLREFKEEERIPMLFPHLNPLFHFLDYDLLDHLVNKFGSRNLKQKMSKYLSDIDKFMEETTIRDVIDMNYLRPRDKIYGQYSKLTAKFDRNPKDYTLKEVDEFRTRFCDTAKLSRTIIGLLYCDDAKSFLTVWCFPAVVAPDLIDRVTALAQSGFFAREHVQSLTMGRQYHNRQVLYQARPARQEAEGSSGCSIS